MEVIKKGQHRHAVFRISKILSRYFLHDRSFLSDLSRCDRERIPFTKDRGIFSIVQEEYFGGVDEQGEFPRDLAPYNPVIIAAPIYFMKLSAPGRAFMELNREALRGKDIVVFVTLGGKLPEDKMKAIKDFGSGLGLTVRQVAFLQTGKKDEFPQRISELVQQGPMGVQAKQ